MVDWAHLTLIPLNCCTGHWIRAKTQHEHRHRSMLVHLVKLIWVNRVCLAWTFSQIWANLAKNIDKAAGIRVRVKELLLSEMISRNDVAFWLYPLISWNCHLIVDTVQYGYPWLQLLNLYAIWLLAFYLDEKENNWTFGLLRWIWKSNKNNRKNRILNPKHHHSDSW